MSKGFVEYDDKKKEKKKRSTPKNVFTLGFDPGFTQLLLQSKANQSKLKGSDLSKATVVLNHIVQKKKSKAKSKK